MPRIFFLAGFIFIVVPVVIWFLRQIFTKEELGEKTESKTLDSQPTLREKQLHFNEEVSTLKSDLVKLEHDAEAEKKKAQAKIDEADKISDDLEDKQFTISKL